MTVWEKRCWAQVDLAALRQNFALTKQKAAGADVMAVVKADAYGHGDAVAAPLFEQAGADAFAVASVNEALHLRDAGITRPILILGHTDAENAAVLAQHGISQTVVSCDAAQALSRAAEQAHTAVSVHWKLDTGMSRIGFPAAVNPSEAAEQLERVLTLPGLRTEGIFTHFAAADSADMADKDFTRRQYACFENVLRLLAAHGFSFPLRHCCNSAGVFAWPDFHLDMVRPGIILYGEQPSADTTLEGLCPAMRLCASVAQVKTLHAGDAVGYGCTFHAEREMRTATLTAGYADGYPRALSGCGIVSLHNHPARVLGRVCMDQLVVDVTDIPEARAGDTAILFGGGAADSTQEAARKAGTISYELLCGISRRVPRIYTDGRQDALVLGTERKPPKGRCPLESRHL